MMASSDVRDRVERGFSREVPLGDWAGGVGGRPEGMHIHLHLGEGPPARRRRPLLIAMLSSIALVVAFGAGQFSAPRPASRIADLELPADLALARRIGPLTTPSFVPAAPANTAGQLPAQPQLPPALQLQLAQPPRIVLPATAPATVTPPATAQPGSGPRNAFGLER
ncbi:hypothetical protein [Roseomonas populi]|uniref:Uncharacterized protein n=1 Tax=Roseomonas populi TaxID=3121582 RepID=A0ABT1X7P9_9PROT|nr:hypothetical protein [Roseomonas pecuniae]MCR0984132.1 hypothetical protein [Roseomonas pecuniae]